VTSRSLSVRHEKATGRFLLQLHNYSEQANGYVPPLNLGIALHAEPLEGLREATSLPRLLVPI